MAKPKKREFPAEMLEEFPLLKLDQEGIMHLCKVIRETSASVRAERSMPGTKAGRP